MCNHYFKAVTEADWDLIYQLLDGRVSIEPLQVSCIIPPIWNALKLPYLTIPETQAYLVRGIQ